MQFLVALTALASVASAASIHKRDDSTAINFTLNNFAAYCQPAAQDCYVTFLLNGGTPCSANEPAAIAFERHSGVKDLPDFGETSCGNIKWKAVNTPEDGFMISATNDDGLTGTYTIPDSDFTRKDGGQTYTGSNVVILYGPST